jgi:DNA-binding NarL/FixJ family response regulator
MMRILLVDDHAHFRKQLRRLIETQADWEVCCEAADGKEAVEKHRTVNPHLTIMDFNMPGLDGLNASRQILRKKPDAPILMVSVFASQQLADEAKKAGIKGFCPKSEAECIIEAVEMLLRGKKYFPPVVH